MEGPWLPRRASYSQIRDVRYALDFCKDIITRRPQDEVLHIACGCGDITNRILAEYLESFKKIVGTDTSEELLSYARGFNSRRNSIYYVSLDITQDRAVINLPRSYQMFDKIFCFSCFSWSRHLDKALASIRYLLKTNGKCFISFVCSSPVYNTYKTLSENPRWAKYMKDHLSVVPFTHVSNEPEVAFANRMKAIGLEVLSCKTANVNTLKPCLGLLKEHVADVNHFTSRIPSKEKSDFVDDCMKVLLDLRMKEEKDVLSYKLVTAYGINPSELRRYETLNVAEEPAANDTDEDGFCFVERWEAEISEKSSEQPSYRKTCTVS